MVITIRQVKEIQEAGIRQFPFILDSSLGKAIMDDRITFKQYADDKENQYAEEFQGKCYKYTKEEMVSGWHMVEEQRKIWKACFLFLQDLKNGLKGGLNQYLVKEGVNV